MVKIKNLKRNFQSRSFKIFCTSPFCLARQKGAKSDGDFIFIGRSDMIN